MGDEAYEQRDVVERAIAELGAIGRSRPLGERDFVLRGNIDVASIRIWLRNPIPRSERHGPGDELMSRSGSVTTS